MKRVCRPALVLAVAVTAILGLFWSGPASAQSKQSGVDRLYILDCGNGHATDQSRRWTPGVNVGKPIDISVNCYLIHHAQGYFLWDTGISDHVASMPNGWYPTNNPSVDILWTRAKTLMSQLKEINVAPSDIRSIGISHTHPDHIGNAELFPSTPILIQKAEFEYFFGPAKPGAPVPPAESLTTPPGDPTPGFSKNHPTKLIDEDLDVFGDGSVMIIATPGHTPGHDSLLVHLPKTGWVILTADAVHLRTNWDNDRIPYFATMPADQRFETLLSMQRMRNLMSFYHAQLWINHDKAESDLMKKSPKYYE
jgi:N-acyl homoserine lactone hydrolase